MTLLNSRNLDADSAHENVINLIDRQGFNKLKRNSITIYQCHLSLSVFVCHHHRNMSLVPRHSRNAGFKFCGFLFCTIH